MKPLSTYRLQLNRDFPFSAAEQLVPYLSKLGISHVYCSPILTARPGSLHGYDVCDHGAINPELGGEEGFRRLAAALRAHGMGIVVDFVPNHMCADARYNRWWRDVLANGPSSLYSHYFDIDWDPVKPELKQKILLPILGAPYGEVLESGQFRLKYQDGHFLLRYWEHELPLNPRQARLLLRHRLEELEARRGAGAPDLEEMLSVLFQLDHLPAYTETSMELRLQRHRELEVARRRLVALLEQSSAVRNHVEQNLRRFEGSPGDPRSFDLLHEMLEAQPYRLAYWRTALHEINYRRFFDINELAALRMEDPEVFEEAHRLILALAAEGLIDGIRLDHVDGLFDPVLYVKHLRERTGSHFYIVVEKILSGNEPLDADLHVDGTTGYGFLNLLSRVFLAAGQEDTFRRIYARFTGRGQSFQEVVADSKRLIIGTSMASELNVLAHELNRMSERSRRDRDFTLLSLQEALREVVAAFGVYRTYISPLSPPGEADQRAISEAVTRAIAANPALESSIFSFVKRHLLPEPDAGEDPDWFQRRLRFAMKFQQYTSPVQAKGVEDTAFYRYAPLASLNEVGGEPEHWGSGVEAFHAANRIRQERLPHAMLATSTHDTKRGEDARARIHVLSEIPDLWRARLLQWSRINAPWKTLVQGKPAPDAGDEYLYYQSLIGSWPCDAPDPAFTERLKHYMGKAVKEAKIHTSWVNPSNDYDSAMERFVEATLSGAGAPPFLKSFAPFARLVAWYGALNSLGQLVLKTACPGVPDYYQSSEVWNLSLVDPDNRRPVDFAALERRLHSLESSCCPGELLARWPTGEIKLWVTWKGLRLRRERPELFIQGEYIPLRADGPRGSHLAAFARRLGDEWCVALALREPVALLGFRPDAPHWAERMEKAALPLPEGAPDEMTDVLTGAAVRPADPASVLRQLPVAILYGRGRANGARPRRVA